MAEIEPKEDTRNKRPMAVKEPSQAEQIEALKIRMYELENVVEKHRQYHFGRVP